MIKRAKPYHYILFLLWVLLFTALPRVTLFAQTPPQYGEVTMDQPLLFGAFSVTGYGGTVSINKSGTRSSSGNITLLNTHPVQQAEFGYRYTASSIVGRFVNFNVSATKMTKVSGTPGEMGLSVSCDPSGSTWVGPLISGNRNKTIVVWGTLDVGSLQDNPPGDYIGYIYVTDVRN